MYIFNAPPLPILSEPLNLKLSRVVSLELSSLGMFPQSVDKTIPLSPVAAVYPVINRSLIGLLIPPLSARSK